MLFDHLLPLAAYKHLDMSVFIKNTQGHYIWGNDFFITRAAGYLTLDDIYNKDDYEFIWHDYADSLRANDAQVFENKSTLSVIENSFRYEKNRVTVVSRKSPLFNSKQQIIGLMGVCIELPKNPVLNVLSNRERTAVLLMSEGLTDKQIAKKILVSPRTVESFILHAKQKLNVKTRAELIVKICSHP